MIPPFHYFLQEIVLDIVPSLSRDVGLPIAEGDFKWAGSLYGAYHDLTTKTRNDIILIERFEPQIKFLHEKMRQGERLMWYYSYPKHESMHGLPFYIVGIGQHELQPYISKPEGHPRDQFFYGTKGAGVLKIYGKRVELPAGCGFYIPAAVPHS